MLNKMVFASREAFRLFQKRPSITLHYLFFSLLHLLLISMGLVLIINFNYFQEVIALRFPSGQDFRSAQHVFSKLINYRNILFMLTALLVLSYIYSCKKYLKKYLINYQQEIGLIYKLNGNIRLSRSTLIYSGVFIEISSVLLTWGLTYLVYQLLIGNKLLQTVYLLSFASFKLSLLIILLFIGTGSSIVMCYYLFLKVKNILS